MERMKELTVCIQNEYVGKVVYRTEVYTEEEYKMLEEENKKLKEKLEQIKETYIKFEDSEKEYNKWLGELDQLIMNR